MLYLFAEFLLIGLAAFGFGLGLSWLLWGRRRREG